MESWPELRRNTFAPSKYRPKGDRNTISLDYAINRENDLSPAVPADAAILEDPFDADWAALALRSSNKPISVQRHPFHEKNAFKSFELNM